MIMTQEAQIGQGVDLPPSRRIDRARDFCKRVETFARMTWGNVAGKTLGPR
jgi:hypothetical protein